MQSTSSGSPLPSYLREVQSWTMSGLSLGSLPSVSKTDHFAEQTNGVGQLKLLNIDYRFCEKTR